MVGAAAVSRTGSMSLSSGAGSVIDGPRLRWRFPEHLMIGASVTSDASVQRCSIVGGLLRSTGRALVFDAAGLRLSAVA